MTGSQADYARYRGVSRKTVTLWKQRGLIVLDSAGKVDFARTDKKHIGHFGNLRIVSK